MQILYPLHTVYFHFIFFFAIDRHRIFDANAECVDNGVSLWTLRECVCCVSIQAIANWLTDLCVVCCRYCCCSPVSPCEWAYGPFDLLAQKWIHAHNRFSFPIFYVVADAVFDCWWRARVSSYRVRYIFLLPGSSQRLSAVSQRIVVLAWWEQWYQFKYSELCRNKVILSRSLWLFPTQKHRTSTHRISKSFAN